jgi:thiol:disulfide interchange protein
MPRFATLFAVVLFGGQASGQEVKWRTDYAAARKEAVETGKPLLLDFGTEWCGPCKKLEATTFRDPKVVATLNDRFIPVKLNGDKETRLVAAMSVDGFPTLIVAAPDGKVIARQSGFLTASQFTDLLSKAPAAKPAASPRTPEFDADRALFRSLVSGIRP